MWRRVFVAEKQSRDQAEALHPARFIRTAHIISPKPAEIPVARNVTIPAEDAAGTLKEIGNDHDVGLVISRPCFDPCVPLAHVIGRSKVCVPIIAPYLQTTEFVDQKE